MAGQKISERTRPGFGRTALALAIVGAGIVGFFLNGGRSSDSDDVAATADAGEIVKPPIAVETLTLRRASGYTLDREYVGRVESARDSDVAFETGGKIATVLVDEGDSVRADQPLAKLDTQRLVAERAVRLARRDAEQARLDELISGPRSEAIDAAKASVKQLESDLKLARLTEGRQERIFRSGASPEQKYDEARLASESLASRLAATKSQLEELQNGTRAEALAAQRANLANAIALLESIDVDIAKSTLYAPFAGQIAVRRVDEGEVVAAGTSVFQLLETTAPEIRLGVPGEIADRLNVGDSVTAVVRDEPRRVEVKRVLPDRARLTRTVDVILGLSEEADASSIRPGDMARVSFERTVPSDGFRLPIGALVEGVRGLWSCYVVMDGDGGLAVDRRPLEILFSDQSFAYVTGPIDDGDEVVIAGVHRLVPGQSVRMARSDRVREGAGLGDVEARQLTLGTKE